MAIKYTNQRARKTPPHVDLKTLRLVSGQTQQSVCDRATRFLQQDDAAAKFTPGALSAVESGLRGASQRTLAALEFAYNITPGSISTDYLPRRSMSEAS